MSTFEAVLSIIGIGKELSPAEADRKRKLKEIAFEQSYQSALANAQAKQAELRGLPGAEEHSQAIGKLIKAAEKLADAGGKLKDAFEKLAPANDLNRAGKREADLRREAAESQFKPLFEVKREQEGLLTGDASLPESAKQAFRLELEQAVRPLLDAPRPPKAVDGAAAELKRIRGEIRDALRTVKHEAEAAQLRINQASEALRKLEGLASLREIAKFARQKSEAEALVSQREFEAAIVAAESARDDALLAFEEITREHDAWLREAPAIDGAKLDCQRHAALKSPPLETVPPTIGEIEAELNGLAPERVGQEIPYSEARETLARCLRSVATNERRADEYSRLGANRDAADKVVKAALEATRQKIIRLEGDVERKTDQSVTMHEQHAQLAALKQQWAATRAMALTEDALDTNPLLDSLKEIEAAAEKAASPGKGQSALIESSHVKRAMPAHDNSQAACRAQLAELNAFGAAASKLVGKDQQPAALEAKLAKNVSASLASGVHGEEIERLTAELNEIADAAKSSIKLVSAAFSKLKLEVEKSHKQVANDLKAFHEKLERYADSFFTKDSDYEKYVTVLDGELVSIEGMMDGADLDLLELAKQELTRLRARVESSNKALDATDAKGDSLKAVDRQASRCAEDLNDVELTKYLPESKAQLSADLEEINAAKLTTPVDETLAALGAWRKKLTAAQSKAIAAKDAHDTFVNEQAAAKKLLTAAKGSFGDAEDFYKHLLKQFDRLPAAAKAEGGLDQAKKDLELLKQQVQDAIDKPESRKAGQAEAKRRLDSEEEDKIRWKGLYDDYQKKVLPEVKAKKVASQTYDDLVALGKSANTAFTKTKDYESAKFQLNHAKERARFAIEFPEGLELAGRNNLPKVQAKWKAAVAGFLKKLEALHKAVSDKDAEAGKAVDKTTKEIGRLFNASAFDPMIYAILRADATADEKQSQREAALAVVRRYRRYVQNDHRFKELANNPFVTPFTGNFELNVALLDVEKNLLISL